MSFEKYINISKITEVSQRYHKGVEKQRCGKMYNNSAENLYNNPVILLLE